MDLSQTLGWIATFLFSIMIIPQMMKTIRTKDTSGVSLFLFIIYFVANIVALVYAILIKQTPLMIKYIISLITTTIYLGLYWVYYNRKKKALPDTPVL